MKRQIEKVFDEVGDIPLFFVESGSRLWGIASPDSDYDVRGFHLQSKQHYFDFKKHRDIMEIMDGDFDFVSYDIDKMFGLLAKSNPTVFEWIRSTQVYYNALPNWNLFQEDLIKNIDYKALFHHYISLAKGSLNLMETERKFTYKTVFYCIRGLLSAELSAQHIIPELIVDELFTQFDQGNPVLTIARESLERKKKQTEKEEVEASQKPIILKAITEFLVQLSERTVSSSNTKQKLETVLTDYSYQLKTLYYR